MESVHLKDIRANILPLLASAQKSIDVAMAWFTNIVFLEALVSCAKRGVKVSVVILNDEINRNDSFGLDFNALIISGASFYLFEQSNGFLHDKFCIIDSKIAITGSYNWTNYAEQRNLENIIITDDETSVKVYTEGFRELIAKAKLTTNYTQIPADLITRDNYEGNFREYTLEQKYSGTSSSVEDSPRVVAVSNWQLSKSKYFIGFHADIDGNPDGMRVLVNKDQSLPVCISKDAWLNEDNIETISCELFFGDINNTIKGNTKLVCLDLGIPKKNKNQLHFKTNLTLDTNGYLHAEFACIETGKCKEITLRREDLIKLEQQG